MCGIAGMMRSEPRRDLGRIVACMTQTLFHRGPDDGGVVTFGPVNSAAASKLGGRHETPNIPDTPAFAALGARRLAILDLSPRGHMPMAAANRLAWIVYNGEVYNHGSLRADLTGEGWVFATGTDTEVILAAWQTWGPACFGRFDGMWAMAIYEPDARRLVLARDPFGIKPLYYTTSPALFAFGSEIKSLLAIPGAEDRANLASVAAFLTEGLIDHTDDTMFAGIHSLPGGKMLTVSLTTDGQLISAMTQASWPTQGRGQGVPSAALLREAIDDAVQQHLRSDVAVGSCLSGGIDSSTIVASIAARNLGAYAPSAFTAVLPGDPLDESRHADALLQATPGIRGHRVEPTGDGLLNALDDILWHQESPFGSPSIYMQWEVMRAARAAGVTVLLDGQGADELFRGYAGYLPPLIAQLAREGKWRAAISLAHSQGVRDHYSAAPLAWHIMANMLTERRRNTVRDMLNALRRWLAGAADIPSDELRREATASRWSHEHCEAGNSTKQRGDVRQCDHAWRRLLFHASLPGLLHFEDRNSMAHSVEARVPFVSRRLVELAFAIPAEIALSGGCTKALLRESQRGRVPDAILDRRDKIGFAAPTAKWMDGPLRHWWKDVLDSPTCRGRGWINPRAVNRLVCQFNAGDARCALALWRCAILESWARKFKT